MTSKTVLQPKSFGRRLLQGALAIPVLISLLLITVRVQQHAFRIRAERLERDIQNLQYGETYLPHALQVIDRWHGSYDHGGTWCNEAVCTAEITIGDFVNEHAAFFSNHLRLLRFYRILGGRPAMVTASISIKKGLVNNKLYAIYVQVFPDETMPPNPFGYTLIGSIATVETIPAEYLIHSPHPAYRIGWPSGCELCVNIFVQFTPAASRFDVQRVSQFDYSCITRWLTPCREKEDILPAAVGQLKHDGIAAHNSGSEGQAHAFR